jgi:hypothetical protein
MSVKTHAFWFIRDGEKLRQCSKNDFDQAIRDGKSVKYGGYPDRRTEKFAERLEASRVQFLAKPDLNPKFRQALTSPEKVVEAQIVRLDEPDYWLKESKLAKYKQ